MKREKGFTLIELMVAMGLFLMVASLVLSVTGTGRVSWTAIATHLFLKGQAQRVITALSSELSQSNSGQIFGPPGPRVHFKIPTVNATSALLLGSGGEVQWGDGSEAGVGNYIQYRYDAGNLTLVRERLGPTLAALSLQVIAQDMTYFNVVPGNFSQYEVSFRLRKAGFAGAPLPQPIQYPPQRNTGSAGAPVIADTNITIAIVPAN